jgi:hypothetical protein
MAGMGAGAEEGRLVKDLRARPYQVPYQSDYRVP